MQSGRQDTLEERYAIKLCFKLGKNATETYGMLQTAFGASCMNRALVFEWHKRSKEGSDEGHWHAHTRGLPWCLPEVVGTVQVHCSRRRLLRRGLEFHVCTINKSAYTKKSGKLFNGLRIYLSADAKGLHGQSTTIGHS